MTIGSSEFMRKDMLLSYVNELDQKMKLYKEYGSSCSVDERQMMEEEIKNIAISIDTIAYKLSNRLKEQVK